MAAINGDNGPNDLVDTPGDDTITAGGGDDTITVTGGRDIVYGDLGNDTLIINWSGATNGIYNNYGPSFDGSYGGWDGQFYGSSSAFDVSYFSIERFRITTGSGNDDISTASGDDVVSLGSGDDKVDVGTGLDQADGGTGIDRISADLSGTATAINWDLITNTYSGPTGSAFTNFEYFGRIYTGSGNDTIVSSAGSYNETIYTGSGNDTITVGGGVDVVHADAGTDTLVVNFGAATNGIYNNYGPQFDGTFGGWDGQFYGGNSAFDVSYYSVENFIITSGSGNDDISTASGDDVVSLGSGDDKVDVGTGLDQADGGAGIDRISADLSGTATAINWDLLSNTYSGVAGTSFTNFEYFGRIYTGSGSDTIVSSAGSYNETIYTGSGNDTITVGGGVDVVHADAGTDTLVVNFGTATTGIHNNYGPQFDGTFGGWDGQFYGGNSAFDVSFYSVENFVLTTGSGNDDIITASGDDVVSLGSGDDKVDVGTGLDQADGGAGTDRISADLSGTATAINWDLLSNTYSGVAGTSFTNFEYFGTIHTGSGSDTIVSSVGSYNETIYTGSGNDTITVGGGADVIHADAGTDTLVVNFGAATSNIFNYNGPQYDGTFGGWDGQFYGGSSDFDVSYYSVENFILTTGSGNDDIATADGNDVVSLGSGNDRLNVGSGLDQANGGSGFDIISADQSAASVAVNWNIQTNSYSGVAGTAFTNFESFGTIYTGSGNDTIVSSSGSNNETIFTGSGSDTITVSGGVDVVHADAGIDTLIIDWRAATSNISNYFGPQFDGTFGGWDGQFYGGSPAFDVTYYSVDNFRITTGSGSDNIVTGDGNDTIDTGDGADTLDGGAGINTLIGGAGNDRLIVGATGSGSSVDGGADYDTLAVSGSVWLGNVAGIEAIELASGSSLTLTSSQVMAGLAADTRLTGSGTVTVNIEPNVITTITGFQGVGAPINFVINGTSGDDVIKASNFDNTIYGGAGRDFMRGGNGVDTIDGGADNDKITGWGGADILTGGSGSDQFRYLYATDSGVGAAADRITDFTIGSDVIDLRLLDKDLVTPDIQNYSLSFIGSASFDANGAGEIRTAASGSDLLVQFDLDGNGTSDMEIVLQGLAGQSLSVNDFMFGTNTASGSEPHPIFAVNQPASIATAALQPSDPLVDVSRGMLPVSVEAAPGLVDLHDLQDQFGAIQHADLLHLV